MPRKGPAPKRPLVVDPVYQSPLVTALVNKILLDGKKSIAETIVYGALEGCREKTGTDPVQTLKRALDNIKPTLEVKSRRVGGATYQVPIEVKPTRATTLSLRWLVGYSRQRREKTMTERLMNEILDASNGLGAAVKRREDTHKMAESNKAFAHYRWLPHRSGMPSAPAPGRHTGAAGGVDARRTRTRHTPHTANETRTRTWHRTS
jgi:small subunit ribosomal protein S7